MSWDFYTITYPVARKDYPCDAMEWILNDQYTEFTSYEMELIDKAKSEGSKILKGTRYIKVTGKWEGEMSCFRARPEIHEICKANDIYQE